MAVCDRELGGFPGLGRRSRVDSDGNFMGKSEYKSTNGIMLDYSVKLPILGALGQVQWGSSPQYN